MIVKYLQEINKKKKKNKTEEKKKKFRKKPYFNTKTLEKIMKRIEKKQAFVI